MAELSAVPFSALPSTDDGYTLLNDNGIVHKSSKKLSELVGDKTSSFLTKEEGDTLYQEKGDYLVDDDITGKLDKSQYAVDSATFLTAHQDISNKLDTTAFSTVSGDFLTEHQNLDEYAKQEWVNNKGFLTEHQPISADEWNNVYETVVANSGTWGTESDWEPDIISASNNTYNSAVEWVKNQNYLTEHQDISNKLDTTSFSAVSGSFITAHQDISNKMDKSESENFYPMTGNPSGFATINYVDTEIGKIGSFEVVDLKENKPDVNEPSTKIIYLTKEKDSEKSDPYTEWIYNDTTSAWECIGETTLDLVNYYTKSETSAASAISAALDLKEDKIFVANEKTSFADIKAAYDDGKKIYLKLDNFNENNPGVGWSPYEYIVPLNNFYTFPGGSAPTGVDYYIPTYWFQFYFLNDGNPHKLIIVKINDNDRWSTQVIPLNPDLTDYYTKSETSGAAEISAALDLKEDKLTFAGKNNTITAINNSAIGGGGGESTTYNNGYLISIDSNNNINIRNNNCKANTANYAYAFGTNTTATGFQSFAIGYSTKANGNCAFAEGSATSAQGKGSHAEGYKTYVPGEYSHAEGSATTADGNCAHSEGLSTKANGYCSHAEGQSTFAQGGNGAHAEGYQTNANGSYSHAEGASTTANNNAAHAEGNATKANGNCSHAEGQSTSAQGSWSHSEGYQTNSSGNYAHTEGNLCVAGVHGHAEGYYTTAIGLDNGNYAAHAEGYLTLANGGGTHAEGCSTVANSDCAHAEGYQTNANGSYSHAEGWSTSALGQASHAAGKGTIALYNCETVVGYYNASAHDELSETGKPIFVVGNGKQYTTGHDAFIVTMDGIASATNLHTSAGYVVTDVIITSADNSTTSFVTNGVADLTSLYTYIKSLEDRIAALEAK